MGEKLYTAVEVAEKLGLSSSAAMVRRYHKSGVLIKQGDKIVRYRPGKLYGKVLLFDETDLKVLMRRNETEGERRAMSRAKWWAEHPEKRAAGKKSEEEKEVTG